MAKGSSTRTTAATRSRRVAGGHSDGGLGRRHALGASSPFNATVNGMSEADLDLVLITGAGASCPFGVNDVRLPLMGDWSDHVLAKLASVNYALPQAAQLEKGLSGIEFERRLGTFLRSIQAFDLIKPLIEPSLQAPGVPPQVTAQHVLGGWHTGATALWQQAQDALHASLYELFGDPAVDTDAAASAYAELLTQLGATEGSRWVYATTNYDTIGERVIERIGGIPDWGEPRDPSNYGEHPLDVRNLVDGAGRYVPVLHLHGRIGWFRRSASEGGRAYGTQTKAYTHGIGVPIVMLPDIDKTYDGEPVIATLWEQFQLALRRTQRVFVLGHSLHDQALVRALQTVPRDRLAIASLPMLAIRHR
jgi:hypothetical protein